MKIFVVFAVILSVIHVNSAMTAEEIQKSFMEKAIKCKSQEGASDDDVALMASKQAPTSKEGKCLIACIAENDGVVSIKLSDFKRYQGSLN